MNELILSQKVGFLKKYNVVPTIIACLILSQAVVGLRVSEGQGEDLNNLIGSQIIIFLMTLTISFSIQSINVSKISTSRTFKIFLSIIISAVISTLTYYISPYEDFPLSPLRNTSLSTAILRLSYRGIIIAIILYPMIYYYTERKTLEQQNIRNEQIKRRDLQSQLNSLRNQMNPHFLMNSLNVLISGTNDTWVKGFALELSRVYRYLLEYDNEDHLAKVYEEIDFVKSYLKILKERFEEGLQIDIQINEKTLEKRVPHLSLQILIENSVKHNIISPRKPLFVSIYTSDNHIIVKNNVQKKRENIYFTENTGLGIENIVQRYKLLADLPIIVEDKTDHFTVKLPLL